MGIKVLDPRVVARIAAGEVVERPASVVKELVENALDAGATEIAVETAGGGVSLIRVTDNGSGIAAGEVEAAFERHATSKITSFEDLAAVTSLGFRGEALPSIAAVAEVELLTRTPSETAGSMVVVSDGSIGGRCARGRPVGTTVTVRGLFRRVPARLKFLKSAATENSHIAAVVSQYSFAYPEVRFTLTADGRVVLRTSGAGRLVDSITQVYGPEVGHGMLSIEEDNEWRSGPEVRVTGMVGAPSLARASRGYTSFFVNRRWINSRVLNRAVEEGYHGLLMVGKYPVAVINISLLPAEVDVNIHPAKSEVKFEDERRVFAAVENAVRRTLLAQAPVPKIEDTFVSYSGKAPPRQCLFTSPALKGEASGHEANIPLVGTLPVLRVLGQLALSYIVAEGPDGLYLIDQHAAHERILFEKVKSEISSKKLAVQGLLEPATFDVSPQQEQVWRSRRSELSVSGFSVEPFGERTFLVRSVPAVLYRRDWAAALREIMDDEGKEEWTEKLAHSLACHGAIKANQTLSIDEMREMVRQLEATVMPQTCPHGRPTLIRLSADQIAKQFGR